MNEDYKKHIEDLYNSVKPIEEYKNAFIEGCKEHRERLSTGITMLDKMLNGGLDNELYIMAAQTSTGKSAITMSIAQAIARNGNDVLYFALEMSKNEFIARAISSISYEHHKEDEVCKKFTAADVLYWTYDEKLGCFVRIPYDSYEEYAEEYFKTYGHNMHIIEGGTSGLTVNEIANICALWKARRGRPVVFIDYLQLIRADSEDRSQADRKTKIDTAVSTLKALASQIGMPVLVLSSISRSKYSSKVGAASFKESGDTEYTGGVLMGWNWKGVTDTGCEAEIEAEIEACKRRGYRTMTLEILKYRNAERDTEVQLKYYPAFNCFEEDASFVNNTKKSKKKPIVEV